MADEKQGFDSGIHEVLRQLDFWLTQAKIDALFAHYSLLKKWNQRMNLTGIHTLREVVWRHFGESLAVAKAIGPGTGQVVDVGSGGGFPGFPVSVCWPDRPVTLVESIGKKAVFLRELVRLQPNATVFEGRFQGFEEAAEWVLVRAVAFDEVRVDAARVAGKAALLISRDQASSAEAWFDPAGVQEAAVPWNAGALVMFGHRATP